MVEFILSVSVLFLVWRVTKMEHKTIELKQEVFELRMKMWSWELSYIEEESWKES